MGHQYKEDQLSMQETYQNRVLLELAAANEYYKRAMEAGYISYRPSDWHEYYNRVPTSIKDPYIGDPGYRNYWNSDQYAHNAMAHSLTSAATTTQNQHNTVSIPYQYRDPYSGVVSNPRESCQNGVLKFGSFYSYYNQDGLARQMGSWLSLQDRPGALISSVPFQQAESAGGLNRYSRLHSSQSTLDAQHYERSQLPGFYLPDVIREELGLDEQSMELMVAAPSDSETSVYYDWMPGSIWDLHYEGTRWP